MLFGYFDYFVVGVLLFLNIKFWRKSFDRTDGCLLGAFLFGFLVPLFSMMLELERVKLHGGWTDSFEVLYTYLRFPMYWLIGFIQAVLTLIKRKYPKGKEVQ
jgi:hypothetical protein